MKMRTIITWILCSIAILAVAQHEELPRQTLNGKEYYVYKTQPGEGFYAISKKFNISEEDIVKYNPSVKNGLKRNQVIFIPVGEESTVSVDNEAFTHTIKRGETLSAISKMYDVTIDEICELNPNARRRIYAGEKLLIPQKDSKLDATAHFDNQPAESSPENTTSYNYHTIKSGETLYAIAKQYETNVEVLIRSNPGIKPNSLSLGAVIRIPVKNTSTESPLFVDSSQSQSLLHVTDPQQVGDVAVESDTTLVDEQPRQEYESYTAKRRETFFSIARKFNIDIKELKAANPDIRKVRHGMTLNIPVKVEEEDIVQDLSPVVVEKNEPEYLDSLYNHIYDRNDNSHINVAVILPFMLKQEVNVRSALYTEYYQGFLLAVDSLKRQGYSINVNAYDSEDSLEVVKEILTQPMMTTMDLIIAPDDDRAIDVIADFGEQHDINVVNTFSMKNEKVNTNARLFQSNIPGSYLYAEVIALFVKTFSDKTIVFLHNTEDSEPENEFITALKTELAERNMNDTVCNYTTVLELSNLSHIRKLRSVLFIPTSNKKEAIATTLPALEEFVANNPQCNVSLFGYPSWVPQINKNINRFYKLDTYMFSRFYTIPNDNRLYDLSIKYLYWYNSEMKNASPRYALLGFDTGMYFMSAIARYGKNFANYDLLPEYRSIQTDFKFERINNWSGFINKSFYFVHLAPNHTIEKISE